MITLRFIATILLMLCWCLVLIVVLVPSTFLYCLVVWMLDDRDTAAAQAELLGFQLRDLTVRITRFLPLR